VTREVETGSPVIDQFPAFENDGTTKRSGLLAGDFTPTVYRDGAVVALPVTITPVSGDPGEYKTVFTPDSNGFYELHVLVIFNGEIRFARYESVTELTHDLAEDAREQAKKIDVAAVSWPPASNSLIDRITNKDGSQTYDKSTDSLEAIRDYLVSQLPGITGGIVDISTEVSLLSVDLSRVLGLLHQNAILDNQTYDGQNQLTSARLRVFDSAANVPTTPGGSETVGLLHEYSIESEWAGIGAATKFLLKRVL
jgi:hypothetical protein